MSENFRKVKGEKRIERKVALDQHTEGGPEGGQRGKAREEEENRDNQNKKKNTRSVLKS